MIKIEFDRKSINTVLRCFVIQNYWIFSPRFIGNFWYRFLIHRENNLHFSSVHIIAEIIGILIARRKLEDFEERERERETKYGNKMEENFQKLLFPQFSAVCLFSLWSYV